MFTNVILIGLLAAAALGDIAVPGLTGRNVITFEHSNNLLSRQELTPVACSARGLQACVLYYTCCTAQEYCDGVGCCPLGRTCTGPVITNTRITTSISTLFDASTSTSFFTRTNILTSTETLTNAGASTSSSTSTSISTSLSTSTPTSTSTNTIISQSPVAPIPPSPSTLTSTTTETVTPSSSSPLPIVSPTTTSFVALPPTFFPNATSATASAPLSTGPSISITPFTGAAAGKHDAPLAAVFACLGLCALLF